MKLNNFGGASLAALALLSCDGALAAPKAAALDPQVSPYALPSAMDQLALAPDGKHLALVSRKPYAIAIFDEQGNVQSAFPVLNTRISRQSWIDSTHLMTVRTGYQNAGDLLPTQLLHQAVVVNITDRSLKVPLKEIDTTAAVVADGGLTAGSWKGKPALYMAAWGVGSPLPSKNLFRYDVESGRSYIFDTGSFDAGEWVVTPAGELVAKTTYDPSTDKWSLLGRDNGHWKTLRAETSDRPALLVGQGRTEGTILLLRDGELLESSASAGGPGVSVAPADAIVEAPLFDRDTGRLIGMKLAGEPPHYQFFDTDMQNAWAKTQRAFKGKRVALIDYSADRKTFAVTVNEAGGPASVYLIEIAAGKANILGDDRPDLKPEQIGAVSLVDYTARDGLALNGVLTLPSGRPAKALPLVVIVGDMPDDAAVLSFDEEAQFFASKGYAVFKPNTRGSATSTQSLRRAGLGQLGRAMQTDIIDGVEHLTKAGVADPGRVCIMGDAYGAYAATAAVTVQKQAWRCAIGFGGDYDLNHYAEQEDALVRGTGWHRDSLWRRYISGDRRPTHDQVNAIAPVTHAADASAPILLIVKDGSASSRDLAWKLHGALDRAHKPNELTVLKRTTSLVDPVSVDRLWNTELDFLLKSNPPD